MIQQGIRLQVTAYCKVADH